MKLSTTIWTIPVALLAACSLGRTAEKAGFALANDPTYDYEAENPVRVGGWATHGPSREQWFFDHLTGPEGEMISYSRTGSCCSFDIPDYFLGSGALDTYEVKYPGLDESLTVYLDMYKCDQPRVPEGLHYAGPLELAVGKLGFLSHSSLFVDNLGLAIFVLDSKTGCMDKLPFNPEPDLPIALSPDGTRIAYSSPASEGVNLTVANLADGSLIQVTEGDSMDTSPTWSPDGAQLAFSRLLGDNSFIYVVDAGGGDARRATDGILLEFTPSWSPDGARILFSAGDLENLDLFSVNTDGSDLSQLTDTSSVLELSPRLSPNSEHLAYVAMDSDGSIDIFLSKPDGSDPRRLTDTPWSETSLAWSPDGKQIAYCAIDQGVAAIFVMNADGSESERITEAASTDCYPTWSS